MSSSWASSERGTCLQAEARLQHFARWSVPRREIFQHLYGETSDVINSMQVNVSIWVTDELTRLALQSWIGRIFPSGKLQSVLRVAGWRHNRTSTCMRGLRRKRGKKPSNFHTVCQDKRKRSKRRPWTNSSRVLPVIEEWQPADQYPNEDLDFRTLSNLPIVQPCAGKKIVSSFRCACRVYMTFFIYFFVLFFPWR